MTEGAATDFPNTHLVASKDAASIAVALADRSGSAATLATLEAHITSGKHLVSSLTVTSAGFTLVPVGKPGRLGVMVTTPLANGRKLVGEIFIALTESDDPRIGLGAVTIS